MPFLQFCKYYTTVHTALINNWRYIWSLRHSSTIILGGKKIVVALLLFPLRAWMTEPVEYRLCCDALILAQSMKAHQSSSVFLSCFVVLKTSKDFFFPNPVFPESSRCVGLPYPRFQWETGSVCDVNVVSKALSCRPHGGRSTSSL